MMATPIVVPALGESVTEATVAKWMKQVGDQVKVDEALLELETDKVTLEVFATANGTLGEIAAPAGATVAVGALLGQITDGAAASSGNAGGAVAPAKASAPAKAATAPAKAAAAPAASAAGSATPITVPALGESVTEATVAKWAKKVGDAVKADEALLELETDKVTLEVFAPTSGTLGEIVAPAGTTVAVGAVLGRITDGAVVATNGSGAAAAPAAPAATPAPAAKADDLSPAVRKLVAENNLDPAKINGTGKDGRLLKEDVIAYLDKQTAAPAAQPAPAAPAQPAPVARPAMPSQPAVELPHVPRALAPNEERVPMSRLRRRIAERLKQAQNNAAMLTTFNEVDMGAVMALRDKYKESFEKRHKVKLGFMGFFVRAAIQALKEVPAVNGEIDGPDIIYKNHYDIGVAVGTEQGLVVPVVRDADKMSLAEIEQRIAELGRRARDGKLAIEELTGGTFTISNGGVYGSLMSTPILNPPQSGILGMHKIQQRPMVVDGKIEARPMMYLALSYDHRIIDGREAVTFLVRLKDCLEDPQRLILEI
ncbi:2-oxoglutarate dehydrogenase complex dihydrolipoyllysine-residue succinyltransferase [Dongia soli]|uniref:2-oxoglutarate dehydrogenase complex dihydrolipoyllysine-residue succinyltransferase n=1 Tax=Dongia soli TaxID=600628 RepID=UPI0036072DF0